MKDDIFRGPLGSQERQVLCLASIKWRLAFFKNPFVSSFLSPWMVLHNGQWTSHPEVHSEMPLLVQYLSIQYRQRRKQMLIFTQLLFFFPTGMAVLLINELTHLVQCQALVSGSSDGGEKIFCT